MSHLPGYDAIVLAGGTGRRLGGRDKAALEVGQVTLLDRVLAAVADAERVVVVGPPRSLPPGVMATSEQPPGGGPVAGIAAGLDLVAARLVAVLACDLPFVTADTVRTLLGALESDRAEVAAGAQLLDDTGRSQPLLAVYRTAALRLALTSLVRVSNASMRAMLGGVRMLDIEGVPAHAWDCDTWADVDRARERAAGHLLEEP